jgi:hypothetical protein
MRKEVIKTEKEGRKLLENKKIMLCWLLEENDEKSKLSAEAPMRRPKSKRMRQDDEELIWLCPMPFSYK